MPSGWPVVSTTKSAPSPSVLFLISSTAFSGAKAFCAPNSNARFLFASLRDTAMVLTPFNDAAKTINMPSLPGPKTTSVSFSCMGDISNVCSAAARGSVRVAVSGSIFDGISCRVPAATLTSSAKAPSCWMMPVTVRARQWEGTPFSQAVHNVCLP